MEKSIDQWVEEYQQCFDDLKSNYANLYVWFLCESANEMNKLNAETMNQETECTFDGERYNIKATYTLTKK